MTFQNESVDLGSYSVATSTAKYRKNKRQTFIQNNDGSHQARKSMKQNADRRGNTPAGIADLPSRALGAGNKRQSTSGNGSISLPKAQTSAE